MASREPAALAAQLRAHGPAVVLERTVRRRRGPSSPSGAAWRASAKSGGLRPLRTGPVAHQRLDRGRVVAGQPALRRERDLRAEHVPERAGLVVGLAAQRGAAISRRSAIGCAAAIALTERTSRGCSAATVQASMPPHACPTRCALALAERLDQPADVAGERPRVVAARRLVRVAVAAQVDRDRAVTGVAERGRAGGARSTRTRRSRAAAAPAGPRRSPRRAAGCRWRGRRGASTGPSSRTVDGSGAHGGGAQRSAVQPRCGSSAVVPRLVAAVAQRGRRCPWPSRSSAAARGSA